MKNVREMLNELNGGFEAIGKEWPRFMAAFASSQDRLSGGKALSGKEKELICVSIATYTRCEYCIVYHVYEALKAGCTRQEILEAGMMAVAFGGGPSMAYTSIYLKASLDEFEKDFLKEEDQKC